MKRERRREIIERRGEPREAYEERDRGELTER